MSTRLLCLVALAVSSLYSPGQDSAPSVRDLQSSPVVTAGAAEEARTAPSEPPSEPLISPGDLIEFRVFGAPDMTQELRISSAGEAMVALAGPVKIGGMNASEAQRAI